MNSNLWKTGVILALALGMSSLAFASGLAAGIVIPRLNPTDSAPLEFSPPQILDRNPGGSTGTREREALIEPFWEAWDILHEDYVDQPLDDQLLMRGAIRGLVESLGDPHSTYMDPEEFFQANLPLEGEYEGIGAYVETDSEYLTIVSPMPGSPAERAGLQPGDQVIGVDGKDVTGLDGSLVVRQVMGPAGTVVSLTIRREGELEPIVVEILREHIDVPSLESEMLEGNIAYVRLATFGKDTSDDLDGELRRLLRRDPAGLILDLRGNGGGFLHTSIEVASQFVANGIVAIERFGDGRETVYDAESGGRATEIELVVLIDAGSASASEIVAGAIQDHGRALLVGETTFGKGSVQNWIELSDDEGAVRVTIARWYTPDNRLIHGIGLIPDVEVSASDASLGEDKDPQLEKAIELLLGEAVSVR